MSFVFEANLGGNEHNREFPDLQAAIDYAEKMKADPELQSYKIEHATAQGYAALLQWAKPTETNPPKPPA